MTVLPTSVCSEQHTPIKWFCFTCEKLVCSDCAMEYHQNHTVKSLNNIDKEEREKMKGDIEEFKKQLGDWEHKYHGDDETVASQIGLIEQTVLNLNNQVDKYFDELKEKLEDEKRKLKERIHSFSERQLGIRSDIEQAKQSIVQGFKELDNVDTMSTLELMNKKTDHVKHLQNSIQKLSEYITMLVNELHLFDLSNIEEHTTTVKMYLRTLSLITPKHSNLLPSISKEPKLNLPEEFYKGLVIFQKILNKDL